MIRKGTGFYVRTKDGDRGRIFHKDQYINGKMQVYLEESKIFPDGKKATKILCHPSNITIMGFIDS